MVVEGIMLGHKIANKRIDFDREKIHIILELSPPTTIKSSRCFLGHEDFYRWFIKYF